MATSKWSLQQIREHRQEELATMHYIRNHSRHITSTKLVFAPNETTTQQEKVLGPTDRVRVLRFSADGGTL